MKKQLLFSSLFSALFTVLLSGCAEKVHVPPVANFNTSAYMGKWYEIARLDHSFERGLEHVNATYSANPDGTVNVINRGFNPASGKWKEAHAKAVPTKIPGQFKVYFVPLIGGNYQIAMLNPEYTRAVISGGTKDYLWFLSKTPHITKSERAEMISVAKELGYDTDKLITVPQVGDAVH